MKYVSIDVETTGIDLKNCALLEASFVVEDTEKAASTPVEELPHFTAQFCVPEHACWQPGALRMHTESGLLAELEQRGDEYRAGWRGNPPIRSARLAPRTYAHDRDGDFGSDLMAWLLCAYVGDASTLTYEQIREFAQKKLVAAGKNFNGFDKHFLPSGLTSRLHYRVIDAGSVFIDWSKELPPSLDDLRGAKVAHRSLEDARDVVRILRRDYVRPRRVVIESPYAGDVDANVQYARACMTDSLRRGEAPFLSHLLYTQGLNDNIPEQRAQGIAAGFAWGDVADLVAVYTDRGISSGMDQGIARWRARGTPVEMRKLGAA